MVDLCYCLDQVVPKQMSHVWRWLEVGNHEPRTLNTQLSSVTSDSTFAMSAGPYIITMPKQEPDMFFVPIQKKGWKIGAHVWNVDFVFDGFRSTLKAGLGFIQKKVWIQWNPVHKAFHRIRLRGNEWSGGHPWESLHYPSVNPQPWRFTNNSLSLPHKHSFSVCPFLWIYVMCVYFLLCLSFYLCCLFSSFLFSARPNQSFIFPYR